MKVFKNSKLPYSITYFMDWLRGAVMPEIYTLLCKSYETSSQTDEALL